MGCFIPGNPRGRGTHRPYGTQLLRTLYGAKRDCHDRNVPPLDLLLSQINLITIPSYFLEDPTSLPALQITRVCNNIHDHPAI